MKKKAAIGAHGRGVHGVSHGNRTSARKRQVRKKIKVWLPLRLVKGDDSAGPHSRAKRMKNQNGIGKKLQDKPTDSCVKLFFRAKMRNIVLGERDIFQSNFRNAGLSESDGIRVALDAQDRTGRTNETGNKHCHVSHTRTQFQNMRAQTDSCVTKKILGERSKLFRLA